MDVQLQNTLAGAYTLERELGGGGMSRVFLAEETALKRKVVVKILPPDLFVGVNVERFNREILLAAKLQHPHIVPVLAAGETNGIPFYTMPFVEGESLRTRLARGPLPIPEVVSLLRDVAKALVYAHERGIVHRDIKPDNVLVTGGSATVTDFGIAKAISASRTLDGNATLTQGGTSIGTPAYMAPEQAAADPRTDHRADIYAFGCMAYEMLAGRPPFAERTPQRLLAAHMGQSPESIATLRPDTPHELAALITSCLEKEAERRPQRATELVGILESVMRGGALPFAPDAALSDKQTLGKALAFYVATFLVVVLVTKLAVSAIGLPDWVLTGALVVMALGLPAILLTSYVQWVTRLTATGTPTVTPGGSPSVQHGPVATLALKASPHMSWRRTTWGGALALAALVLVAGGFMTLRALGIGPAGSLFGRGSLSLQDRILVADFRAPAADSGLGAVFAEALRTNLEQSRVIGVVSAAGIADALRRMEKPTDSKLDYPLARELAEREGVKGVVHGELAPAGAGFIITARLVAGASGNELASFRVAARDATDLLPAVDRLTREMRAKIGESLKSVRDDPPLTQVTTASLPAWRKYAEGMALHYRQAQYGKAATMFEEAIQLDSTFAMAYMRAANAYRNAATNSERRDSLRARAFRMRERLPGLERNEIEEAYYVLTEQRDSMIAANERVLAIDPSEVVTLNTLANAYRLRREPARAESLYRRAIALNNGSAQASGNIVSALLDQGKVAEAKAQIAEAVGRFPAYISMPLNQSAAIALMEERFDSAEKLLDRSRRSEQSGIARDGLLYLANMKALRGHLAAELQLRDSLFRRDSATAFVRSAAEARVALGLDSIHVENWIGERHSDAVRRLDAVVAGHRDSGTMAPTALLFVAREYAVAGETAKAKALLGRFDREVRDPIELRRQSPWRPWTDGEIALAERRYPDAIAKFRAADSLYDHRPHVCAVCTQVLLGRAFDLAQMPDSAIAAFERYVTGHMAYRFIPDGDYLAGTYKRLGELYEAKGGKARAASYYTKFIALWQDADPELQPKVTEVRRRLAHLNDQESRR